MSLHDQARHPADTPPAQTDTDLERAVRDCLDAVLAAAAHERSVAVADAVARTRAEADARLQDALAVTRAEAEAVVAAAVEAAVAREQDEAARELEAAVALARDDARREPDADALALARDEARDEARREFDAALADARAAWQAEQDRAVEDARAAAHAETDAEVARLRAEHAEALARAQEAQEALSAARAAAAEEVEAERARARAEFADSARAIDAFEATARTGEREATLAGTEALRDAIVRLDEATSLSECLDALSDAVGQHAARSMVFVIRGHALRAWRLAGFDEGSTTAAAISVPLDLAGELWQVAERGRAREVHPQTFGVKTDPALAFARLDEGAVGLALPVCVAGKAVALVYGDDGGASAHEVPSRWPEAVEILARHAGRCLEVLTAARSSAVVAFPQAGNNGRSASAAAPSEAPHVAAAAPGEGAVVVDLEATTAAERYAKLLVSEVKLYNEAAVRVARHKRDIRVRLRAEIERARRLYHERVSPSVETRDEIFDRELVQILADGQPDLLGSDMPEAV